MSVQPGIGSVPGEHPNALAYRRTADLFRARDIEKLRTLIDSEVVWHVPGASVRAGEIRGLEAVVHFLRTLPAGFTIREHDVFGNDQHVVALSYMGIRRPDFEDMVRVVSVFHFRNGRQVERWFYPEDMVAWDRVLGLPPGDDR